MFGDFTVPIPPGGAVIAYTILVIIIVVCMYVCICVVTHIARVWINRVIKVVDPARGQLNRKNDISLSPFAPGNLVSRAGFGSPVPRQPAHLHTQAESGAYLWDSSRVPRRRPSIYLNRLRHRVSPEFIGSPRNCVPMAFTAESPPARVSKPQGSSSKRVLPWQVTMDQSICASIFPHPL